MFTVDENYTITEIKYDEFGNTIVNVQHFNLDNDDNYEDELS